MNTKVFSYVDIVDKLIGSVNPVGETRCDEKRFENLKVMCGVAEHLVMQIKDVASDKNRHEGSIAMAGKYAYIALADMGFVDAGIIGEMKTALELTLVEMIELKTIAAMGREVLYTKGMNKSVTVLAKLK